MCLNNNTTTRDTDEAADCDIIYEILVNKILANTDVKQNETPWVNQSNYFNLRCENQHHNTLAAGLTMEIWA